MSEMNNGNKIEIQVLIMMIYGITLDNYLYHFHFITIDDKSFNKIKKTMVYDIAYKNIHKQQILGTKFQLTLKTHIILCYLIELIFILVPFLVC